MAAPMRTLISRRSVFLGRKCMTVKCCKERDAIRYLHIFPSNYSQSKFDPSILDAVVCPLSKSQLRYDAEASELVNDELGVAYKIVDGIPNLIPQDARMIKQDEGSSDEKSKQGKNSSHKNSNNTYEET